MPMNRRIAALAAAAVLPALPVVAAPDFSGCSTSPDADAITAQRARFNDVIDNTDLRGLDTVLKDVLADDVVLITGTDSDIYAGRVRQLALWAQDFTAEDRLVYVRTPSCIDVSPAYPIALEFGRWQGAPGDGSPGQVSGRYTAKWRQSDGRWQIEVETYMTTECTPPICPQPEKQE